MVKSVSGFTTLKVSSSLSANVLTVGNSTVNSSAVSLSTSWLANTTGLYHTGLMNAASFSVGSTTIANSSGIYGTLQTTSQPNITANNSLYLGGVAAASYVNTSGAFTLSGVLSHTANVSVNGAIIANGSAGTSGQVLTSSAGSNVYWSTIPQYTISTGLVNTSGTVTVNTAYIATLSANNASYLGGVAAASYLTGITSSQVTTALGYTPYNSTNPSGYITSSGLSSYALLSGATFTGNVVTPGPITFGTGDAASGAWIRNDGSNMVISTNQGSMYYGYNGSSKVLNFMPGGTTAKMYMDTSGITYSTTSFRAPIFYDSDNTGYYVDPSSTSNLNGLTVAGTITGSITGSAGSVGGYTPSAVAATANRVVLADANGYIFNNYFNSTDNSITSGVTAVMSKAGDNYYRSASAAAIAAFLSGQTMNIVGTSTNITAYTINQSLGTANGPTFTEIYNNSWFRNNIQGAGLYNQATGRGIWDPGNNAVYGNMSTYGTGLNSWQGWAIPGTFHFMGRSGTDFGLYDSSNGHWIIYSLYNKGYMGLNTSTTSASYNVYVSGNLYATSDIYSASDARIKENVVTIDNALNRVLQMRGVFYNKIKNTVEKFQGKRELGVIAQEVLPILPEVITYDEENDQYGANYGNMAGLFVEAIKEQHNIIEDLMKRIEQLENKNGNN